MARHLKYTCRPSRPAWCQVLLLAILVAVSACANREGRPLLDRWPEDERGSAVSYLESLREYLAMSPAQRALKKRQLGESAANGGRAKRLEYAFALSVEANDEAALMRARNHFEELLAAPEPLPVALDGLVRLQLAAVVDRLESLRQRKDLRETARACGLDQGECQRTVLSLSSELQARDQQLVTLKRKLEALTRIEQTVNGNPEDVDDDSDQPRGNRHDDGRENGNAASTADPAGR